MQNSPKAKTLYHRHVLYITTQYQKRSFSLRQNLISVKLLFKQQTSNYIPLKLKKLESGLILNSNISIMYKSISGIHSSVYINPNNK